MSFDEILRLINAHPPLNREQAVEIARVASSRAGISWTNRKEKCAQGHPLSGPKSDVQIRVRLGKYIFRDCMHCHRQRERKRCGYGSAPRQFTNRNEACVCGHAKLFHDNGKRECYHADGRGAFDCDCVAYSVDDVIRGIGE